MPLIPAKWTILTHYSVDCTRNQLHSPGLYKIRLPGYSEELENLTIFLWFWPALVIHCQFTLSFHYSFTWDLLTSCCWLALGPGWREMVVGRLQSWVQNSGIAFRLHWNLDKQSKIYRSVFKSLPSPIKPCTQSDSFILLFVLCKK